MLKLFKMLKPSRIPLLICLLLVTIVGISSLMLPDRMSRIIGEGITAEIEYERAADGSPIYINIMGNKSPMPKFTYQGAGELVLNKDNEGDYNVVIKLFDYEKDEKGEIIKISVPVEGELQSFPMPVFLRTEDGDINSPIKQGRVVLDAAGFPQVKKKQVSHLDVIWKNGLIMILITLGSSAASVLLAYLSSNIGMRFGKDLRSSLFHKTLYFSSEEENKFGTASLITRMTNDVTQMQMFVMMAIRMMLVVPVMFIGGLIMAFNKDAKMTGILLISAPLVLIIIGTVASKVVPMFKKMQKRADNLTLVSRENITGVRVIRAFGQDERENRRFNFANVQVTELATKAGRIMAFVFPSIQLIMSLTMVGIVAVTVSRIDAGLKLGSIDFTALGNMMAVSQYMMQIMMSVIMFSIIFIMVPRASVSAVRINEVLNTVGKINDPDAPKKSEKAFSALEFKDVSFSFPNASNPVLANINFSLNKGETTAIIGSTGSGKTTLINLIPRMFDVTDGEILINGVNIKDMTLKDLRAKIGFVSQKAVLFEGSVSENISYGRPNATEDEIIEAAKIAQAHNFIIENAEGYQYKIEQDGANLSGGQKQRLAIARAVCRKPDIYIFDDSFSALDFKTDKKLRAALDKVTAESTVIIVAQRIGTIMNADRIIVMQDGRIVGMGRHKKLLRECEVYREIAVSQLSEKELNLETGGVL